MTRLWRSPSAMVTSIVNASRYVAVSVATLFHVLIALVVVTATFLGASFSILLPLTSFLAIRARHYDAGNLHCAWGVATESQIDEEKLSGE